MTAIGRAAPRLVIAGAAGDAGKTLISVELILEARRRGLPVCAFKKGPDYIDAAWLSWASGEKARNLDTFLMGFDGVAGSFAAHATPEGLNVIEGNRGLYDGLDARGTHSTAELAKHLNAPVVLVVKASKVTRSAAAWVLGCQKLDPDVHIAGVVLNQVATPRHERILRQSIETACAIPVLGSLPRIHSDNLLPSRHLGLVTPEEHAQAAELEDRLQKALEGRLETERLIAIAQAAPGLEIGAPERKQAPDGSGLMVGYIRDSAFTFYYPENLEALESAGASLVPISSLTAVGLPENLDALYIGGGFPETHAARISANTAFLKALQGAAKRGLPIYAECGGLMLLSAAIHWKGRRFAMAGVFTFEAEVCESPQGHGYAVLAVDAPNPFFAQGVVLKGHEFHYSRILPRSAVPASACRVDRGVGVVEGRDGVICGSVLASYTHLHALATPEWISGMIGAARQFSESRKKSHDKQIRNR